MRHSKHSRARQRHHKIAASIFLAAFIFGVTAPTYADPGGNGNGSENSSAPAHSNAGGNGTGTDTGEADGSSEEVVVTSTIESTETTESTESTEID